VIRRHTYSAQPSPAYENRKLWSGATAAAARRTHASGKPHPPSIYLCVGTSVLALLFQDLCVAATSRWISGWRARRASRGVSSNSPSRQKNCTKTQSISFAPHCTTSSIFVALGTGLHGGEGRREKLRHFARITTIQADCHRTHLQNKHLPLLFDWEIEAARARPCDSYHAPYVSTWAC